MKFLEGHEFDIAKFWFNYAAKVAQNSKCLKHHCGSVIVAPNDSSIGLDIGKGYNAPPLDSVVYECIKEKLPDNFKGEKHCCVHAEERAIMDAIARTGSTFLDGTSLYFTRIRKDDEILFSGNPYCTICSKLALDTHVSKFLLWHKEGICEYDTKEYNELSFAYRNSL